jgi:hypothetical protein
MTKLREYVRFNTRPEITKTSAIYSGISSEEFPEWMLGLVVVRKLGCLDVSGSDLTVSSVKTLFNYMGQKLKNHENSFNGVISEKIFEGAKSEGENNLSTLEGYRNPREISEGGVEFFSVYAEDEVKMARHICPDMPVKMLQLSMDAIRKHYIGVPLDVQISLMQLAVKKVLPPQALKLMNRETIMGVMAVSQAVLWYRGYHDMAALCSAKALEKGEELTVGGSDHRTRISTEMLEELKRLFPYARRLTAKPKQDDQINVAKAELKPSRNC